ncbi:MAG TPA: histidine kinase dimerization/phospho-acceptor domain-containing protein [Cytophagaceae bacterium]|nr:histidine kinase dimerization/phospho-acceptor domain-containing protein [Cytophagaceae bacterium]
MQNFNLILSNVKRFFRKILNPGFDSIVWQTIYSIELMGLGMSIIYLAYDLFWNENPFHCLIASMILPVYFIFIILILKYPGKKIIQHMVVIVNFMAVIASFIFLAGTHYVSTPTVIDFSLSLLVIMIVYRGWQRILWSVLHAILITVFLTLSILSYTDPEPNTYLVQPHNDFIFAHIEVFSRLLIIFILGHTFIKDYDQQRLLVFNKNEEVNHLNKNLEELVKLRTEKLNDLNKRLRDYSFLNSHKVRAPLARIMGIMNLIHAEEQKTENENLRKYLDLLQDSAEELDRVINEMNAHLSDQNLQN